MTMEYPYPTLSTAYLPSTLYLTHLSLHDEVAIEMYETFPKQTFRNRAVIATGNGLLTLTVPIVRTYGNHTMTHDIGISYQEPWNIRHWRAIVSAYNASPYFLYYQDELESILMHRYDRLVDLNDALTAFLVKKMKLDCTLRRTTDYHPATDTVNDLRLAVTAKHPHTDWHFPSYSQVFDTRYGFQPNLSAIDLLFNLGPEAKKHLPYPDSQ